MFTFPQLSTGALAQYPVRKTRSERTILNLTEDGRVIALNDSSYHYVRWSLVYAGLTDGEATSLTSFFEQCEGPLQSFTFLDPSANLLTYSEDLTQPAWQTNSLLQLTPGIEDPFGTTRATRVTNASSGTLTLTQTVEVSGSVWCAFSAYLSSSGGPGLSLLRTDGSTVASLPVQPSNVWTRFFLSTAFASSISSSCDFSLIIPSGYGVDTFGLQVEAQPAAGTYVLSGIESGVYPSARFDSNQLTVTSTGPNQNSIEITIISKASQ